MQVLRLKRKMGNVSNASSETELRGALAWMVGEEGPRRAHHHRDGGDDPLRLHDRLDRRPAARRWRRRCTTARIRSAFGKVLNQQPLMRNVLADLVLEHEGSLALTLRMARALDDRARRRTRTCWCALVTAGGQVLDLQAHAEPCLRGDGMHRRQRRDGGLPLPAPVPRVAGQRDLGRQRQRAVPGRAARHAEDARPWSTPSSREAGQGARRATPRWTAASRAEEASSPTCRDLEYRARTVVDRMALAHAGRAAGAARAGRRGRGVLCLAPGRRGHRNVGALPRGVDCAAIIERATPRA